jgi:ABC-2 type transport system ATP-binding protein
MPNVVLQADGLTKRYGLLTAVNHLSLDIYEGEIFGLLGPNGAGKTTSINILCGLVKPDAGCVRLHGELISNKNANMRSRVGVCPQEIALWGNLTCQEQLQFIGEMYGIKPGEARRRGERLLEELDLVEKRNQQAHTLSGGMQRRLNLAMALVHDPDVVVLDEAEAGLDPQSRIRVREYIQSLARKKTILLTTHNMDEAERVADRVAIIDHGDLLVLDTPENLKKTVGEGDVLEIEFKGDADGRARAVLEPIVATAVTQWLEATLTVRTLNVVGLLPAIVEALAGAGLQTGEVRLHKNTLEDVFIQLTGRRLRE